MMRGIRSVVGAAAIALVAGSGCCRWWCNNCERFCSHPRAIAAPAPVAIAAPTACMPVVCCPPVCCTPGPIAHPPTLPAAIPATIPPTIPTTIPAQGWQRCP